MKHIKPTMSWATDQNHLNEQLAKYWQREYEDLMLDMEILSEKSLRLVKEAKGVCYEHNVDEFDWNLTEEVEFIAQKYELRIP